MGFKEMKKKKKKKKRRQDDERQRDRQTGGQHQQRNSSSSKWQGSSVNAHRVRLRRRHFTFLPPATKQYLPTTPPSPRTSFANLNFGK
jgi:hypothetical protein